jgi:PKD domain-containing protein/Regulator of Chromosome Condensation (RCC1) repeat protein
VTQVSAGSAHTCALKAVGTLSCWGDNSRGQISVPAGLSGVAAVSAGQTHTCALKGDGTVSCWGGNSFGQANVPTGLSGVIQVSGGDLHTCALKSDGMVICWGETSFYGRVPAGLSGVTQISATGGQSCALKSDGTVVCWGANTYGQVTVPTGLSSVIQVSANRHTCALKSDGTVVCWGANDYGQTNVPAGLNLIGSPPEMHAQEITFTSEPPTSAIVGETYYVTFTGGASGNPVVFTTLTPEVCSLDTTAVILGAAGTCTVAANQAGNSEFLAAPQVTQTFTVVSPNSSPFANAGDDREVFRTAAQGVSVTLDGTGSSDADGSIQYSWSEGDAILGTGATLTYLFSLGTHPVKLTVTDDDGATAEDIVTIVVKNNPPSADAGGSRVGAEGSPIAFDGSGSSDLEGDALSYTWAFGDGTTTTVNAPTVQHTYADNLPAGASYVVTLFVTDSHGATSSQATTSALITNLVPTATFAAPSPVSEGSSINLALTSVRDASGDIGTLEYAFDCGSGAGFGSFTSSASTACPTVDNGTRTVRGKLRDKDGGVTEYSGSVSVVNVAPRITNISTQPNPVSTKTFLILAFQFTDPGSNDAPWYYQIDWGDGKKGIIGSVASQSVPDSNHKYTSPGTYTITVRVLDKDRGLGTATAQVVVVK